MDGRTHTRHGPHLMRWQCFRQSPPNRASHAQVNLSASILSLPGPGLPASSRDLPARDFPPARAREPVRRIVRSTRPGG